MVYRLITYLLTSILLIGIIVFTIRMVALSKCACTKQEVTIPPDTIYVGHEFIFEVNSKYSAQQYWNFGDGAVSTEKTGTHKYQKAGDYKFMSIVNGCCQDTFHVTVIADTATIAPEITVAGGPKFYMGDTIDFQANTSSTDTLQWDFGDGKTLKSNSMNISHVFKAQKNYEVKVKDIRTNKIDSYPISIEKKPLNYIAPPRIAFTSNPKPKSKSKANIENKVIEDSVPNKEIKVDFEPVVRKLPFAFTEKDVRNMILAMANDPDGVNDKGGTSNFDENYKRLKSISDNSNIPVSTVKYKNQTLESYCQKLKTFINSNKKIGLKHYYKINTIKIDRNDLGFIAGLTIDDD